MVLVQRNTLWPLIVQDLEDVVVVGLEIFVAYRLHSLELVECEGTESQEWQMNRTIEIIIGTTGEIQIDAVRFKGPDCEKATKFLEEALGVVGKKIKKPEYHQRSTRVSQQRVWG